MLDEKLRMLGVGGSEAGAVLGYNPRMTAWEVWWSKKGGGQREVTDEMLLGKDLEPVILAHYARRTGHSVRLLNETFRHEHRPWQVGTPDAECTDERRLVELKSVAPWQWFHWSEPPDGLPVWIYLQAQWYMDLSDYAVCDVAALSGHKLTIYPLERDCKLGCRMNEDIADWWTRYIAGDEIPPIEPSDNAREWLKTKFPRPQSNIRLATEEEIGLLTEYAQVRAEAKAADQERDALEIQIQQAIGNSEGLEWEHGTFTWKKPKDSMIPNWKRMADEELLKNLASDEREALIASYTEPRENSRRIHFKTDLNIDLEAA